MVAKIAVTTADFQTFIADRTFLSRNRLETEVPKEYDASRNISPVAIEVAIFDTHGSRDLLSESIGVELKTIESLLLYSFNPFCQIFFTICLAFSIFIEVILYLKSHDFRQAPPSYTQICFLDVAHLL